MTDTVTTPQTEGAEALESGVAVETPAGAAISLRLNTLGAWLPPLLVAIAVLALWYLVSFLLGTRNWMLPYPHAVVTDALFNPTILLELLGGIWQTTVVALTGLAVAVVLGISWAVLMSQAKWIERATFPYAVILQCIPILALVPLIGSMFGYDFIGRTVVAVLIALFPMVSNTLFGLQSVDKSHRELFKLQGASRWTTLSKLQFPAALPAIFAGLRIAGGLAVVGAIVGDFFFQRGTPGIGALISKYNSRLQGPELYGAILLASLLGIVIFWLFGLLTRAAVGKWYDAA